MNPMWVCLGQQDSAQVETRSPAVLHGTPASHAALLLTLQMWPMPAWWA